MFRIFEASFVNEATIPTPIRFHKIVTSTAHNFAKSIANSGKILNIEKEDSEISGTFYEYMDSVRI